MKTARLAIACAISICLSISGCASNSAGENIAIGAAILLGIAAVKYGGGGGYSPQYDSEWDWDEFYNRNHQLVWACRGVQSGQFAEQYHCAGKPHVDYRWPQK